jgi:hypothetical protein
MGKSVVIQIAGSDLENLKNNKYMLCFAKKVNDTYDVVWQSYTEYLANNTFSWTPLYQLFGTNTFADEVQVTVQTNIMTIALGEQSTLDTAGNLGEAVTGGPTESITMINNYGLIHPGLNSVSTGPDGVQRTTAIYVAPLAIETGSDILTPVEKVQVWFQQDLATSTMISHDVSNAIEIDLTTVDSATRLYQNGSWSTPSDAVGTPETFLTIAITGAAAITAALLATKIGAYLTGVYSQFSVKVDGAAGSFNISYSENHALKPTERRHLQLLMSASSTKDTLVEFTMKGLAACNSGFAKVTATVPS